jgi:hypothetical protein
MHHSFGASPGVRSTRPDDAEKIMKYQAHRFSVAPMMDWTDRAVE